jgi:hypothetical protein
MSIRLKDILVNSMGLSRVTAKKVTGILDAIQVIM